MLALTVGRPPQYRGAVSKRTRWQAEPGHHAAGEMTFRVDYPLLMSYAWLPKSGGRSGPARDFEQSMIGLLTESGTAFRDLS